ncbi:hypothetical protein JW962_01060 [Candidatus Dojkabacteria bacterium]|nr:hypothetical protein [Candidatus Dojkabacteria bacterium]
MTINLYIIYSFVGLTLVYNIYTFVVSHKKLPPINRYIYGYLLLSVVCWYVTNAGADLIPDIKIANLFAKYAILFPIHIVNALSHVTTIFPRTYLVGNKKRDLTKIIDLIVIIGTVAVLPFLNTAHNISGFKLNPGSPADFEPGFLYILVMVLSGVFLFVAFLRWFSRYSTYTSLQKKQVRLIASSIAILFVILTIGLGALPVLGVTQYAPLAFISMSILLLIIRENFLVSTLVIDTGRLLGNLFSILIITVIASAELYFIQKFIIITDFVILTIIIGSNLVVFYYSYTRLLLPIFLSDTELSKDIFTFIETSTSSLSLKSIINSFKSVAHKLVKKENVEIVFAKQKTDTFVDVKKMWDMFGEYFITTPEGLLERMEINQVDSFKPSVKSVFGLMTNRKIDVIMPLNKNDELFGLVLLKDLQIVLTPQNFELLSLLQQNFSIAVSRALLYEEVQEFSKTLQKKVDAATVEIRDKMEKMKEMRRRERDMLDIMGHELRTPLTIIKNASSMIDYYETNKMITLDPIVKEQFVNIKEAMNREINLVETMLAATKIDANKIELNLEVVNLNEIIRQTKLAFDHTAKEKGLKLTFKYDKRKNWLVVGDKLRVQEVLDNLVSNAVKYTMEGSVTVTIKEKEYSVECSVTDTGVGVSASDIKNLGKKFFRASPYVNGKEGKGSDVIRPGGTGLGLYVTFGLIKAMGGRIRIESTLGKGSTFTFTLPKG